MHLTTVNKVALGYVITNVYQIPPTLSTVDYLTKLATFFPYN